MQINSLYIQNYRLLNDFKINFRKDISILIGINGSGKSTILECIAQIFSDAFLKEKSKFGFNLVYELRLEEILEQTATSSELNMFPSRYLQTTKTNLYSLRFLLQTKLWIKKSKLKNILAILKKYCRATLSSTILDLRK
jgi:recombinational DNA repair ATPase RecF